MDVEHRVDPNLCDRAAKSVCARYLRRLARTIGRTNSSRKQPRICRASQHSRRFDRAHRQAVFWTGCASAGTAKPPRNVWLEDQYPCICCYRNGPNHRRRCPRRRNPAQGSFLNRIYYDLRNLGTTSEDRALNFGTTNAFQAASTFAEAVATGMELDSITVEKSPFCRWDSDCWDVKLKFFDPENSRRAQKVFRFTIDVSDLIPVTLGEVRTWSSPY